MKCGFRGVWSPTEELGGFLTKLATGRWDGEHGSGGGLEGKGVERVKRGMVVVENEGVRRLMGSDGS